MRQVVEEPGRHHVPHHIEVVRELHAWRVGQPEEGPPWIDGAGCRQRIVRLHILLELDAAAANVADLQNCVAPKLPLDRHCPLGGVTGALVHIDACRLHRRQRAVHHAGSKYLVGVHAFNRWVEGIEGEGLTEIVRQTGGQTEQPVQVGVGKIDSAAGTQHGFGSHRPGKTDARRQVVIVGE